MSGSVTAQRKQLGNELQHARLAAGLTQQEAAELIDCSQAKITRIEAGKVSIKQTELRNMLAGYGVTGEQAEALLDLASASGRRRGQWSGYRVVIPEYFRTFTDLEPWAQKILTWEDGRFPGLVQSEHYMLMQFVTGGQDQVNSRARSRLDRQQIFEQENPPECVIVIGEGAFYRAPGGYAPDVMADQMEHLLKLIDRHDHVAVHVLRYDADLPTTPPDFVIMRFDETIKDFAYVDHPAGGMYVEDDPDLQCFSDAFAAVHAAALKREDTRAFIQRILAKYENE